MTLRKVFVSLTVAFTFLILLPGFDAAQNASSQRNMTLVGHSDLNGHGDGGEGMALQKWPDGRRLLYIAHFGVETCLSIVDVTQPDHPLVVNQLPSPARGAKAQLLSLDGTRCNSLGLSGNILAVANQTGQLGQKPAGMWLLDVSDLDRIKRARTLQDLALSFFDTSGRNSRGVHWLWFVDGEFVHLSTGTADSNPTNPKDQQFYMIVDVRDPHHPREVGRWWLPGTQKQ